MQLGATYYGFPSELSLKPDCNPICLHVDTLGIPAAFVCVAVANIALVHLKQERDDMNQMNKYVPIANTDTNTGEKKMM